MKLLSRTGDDGDTIEMVACNKHANLIIEKWKVLHHAGIFIQDTHNERRCILCPQMAGQR